MTCRDETMRARLDDFVDGTLAPAWSAEVQRHVDGCASCDTEVNALRALLARAALLPPAVEPPRDLWAGIAAGIASADADAAAAPVAVEVVPARAPRRGVHPGWAWSGWLAAAACLALLLFGRSGGPGGEAPADGAYDVAAQGAVLAGLRDWEAGSLQAQDEYLAALSATGSPLPADAAAEIGRNLQALDVAIAETRAALLAAPDRLSLLRLLGSFYEERISLLRRATQLTTQL